MEGEFRYLSGYSADTIMDDEAIRIFLGYFEKNYHNTSLSIEEMISNTFSETAKSIMSKSTNGWDFAKIAVIIIAIIVVVVIAYRAMQTKHKREEEKINEINQSVDKVSGAMSAFERMEAKAEQLLDEANSMAELNENVEDSVTDLESKYDEVATSTDVEDELAKLKKEMGMQ